MKMNTRIRRALAAVAVTGFPLAGVAAQAAPETAVPLAGTPVGSAAGAVAEKAAPPVPVSEHVIVISIDGLRPDAIVQYDAKNLKRLMEEGSYSMEASTILPSKTLPSHTSMLTGTEPAQHGVNWNSEEMEKHGHIATPTIFAQAKQAGLHTAAFFSKSKFEHLAVPGTLDHFEAPHNFLGKRHGDKTVARAEKYLEDNKPNLLFVHIGEPDFVGHFIGWMTDPYGWAVEEADDEVGDLLVAADKAFGAGNYTVIVTADHGGHGRDHGSDDPRDVTIPWITWGKAVHGGTYLGPGIRTMDTAATALWLLGVEPSDVNIGKPVARAYSAKDAEVVTARTPTQRTQS